ncbi:hypothetical protein CTS44_09172 [Comamonas thiooxydans]|nr:hypothetical protein CTS44_09172 [Comamonas thiooxydans]
MTGNGQQQPLSALSPANAKGRIESFALQVLGDRSCQEQPLSPAGLTGS